MIARHKNGAVIIFDMEDPDEAKSVTDLRQYLTGKWGRKLDLSNVEQLTINGMTAWTGSLRRNTQSGPRDIRLIAIRDRADEIFRLVFLTPTDEFDQMADGLKRTTYSFRRLSDAEAMDVKPLRIQIETTESGDTPEGLSQRMAVDSFSLEWFELLNANHRNDSYPAGERVKLILE
ncbi:MAG: hypothetical protein H8E30_05240 [Alphaproteobacteria bacterium]|nr:hypothetical protein [Alphaproteobacteria bacterium]